jgi:hypothetical protein
MPRAKPKRDAPSGYWVPLFKLDGSARRAILKSLPKPPPSGFLKALRNATNRFVGWSNYCRNDIPTRASVLEALKELDSKTRGLMDALNGTDNITRQMISHTWFLDGRPERILDDSERILMDLRAAILGTYSKAVSRPANKPSGSMFDDPREAFVSALYGIFLEFDLKPAVTFRGPFEQCVRILFDAAKETTGDANIHRLASLAAQRHKV